MDGFWARELQAIVIDDGGWGVGVVAFSSLVGLGCAVVRSASSLGSGGACRGGLDRLPRAQASEESLSGMFEVIVNTVVWLQLVNSSMLYNLFTLLVFNVSNHSMEFKFNLMQISG